MIEHKWIEEIEEFEKMREEWDTALEASGTQNPFLLSYFIISWWKSHSKGLRLAIFLLLDNGSIIAGIPLCISKQFGRNIISHIGGCHANITHPFLTDPKIDFVSYLIGALRSKRGWDVLTLDRVVDGNKLINDCKDMGLGGSKGLKCNISEAGLDGIIDLSAGFDEIIKNIPKRLRRYLRSSKESVSEMGGLTLNRVTGAEEVRKLFAEFKGMSLKAFESRDGVSAFQDARCASFYGELLPLLDGKGMLDAHRLTAGPHTLAISFGYRFGPGFKWILTTFNPDHDKLRPGHLLIESLVTEAIAKKDPYFDMYYGGDVYYKQQWCNKMVPLKKIQIYRDNIFNILSIRAESSLRSNGSVMGIAKGVRDILLKLRSRSK